jgi:hypothetical protein
MKNLSDLNSQIKIVDLQRLVLWVLANGENPNWIFVKNKPLIPKVIVVFASGLGYDVYDEHKHPSFLPSPIPSFPISLPILLSLFFFDLLYAIYAPHNVVC